MVSYLFIYMYIYIDSYGRGEEETEKRKGGRAACKFIQLAVKHLPTRHCKGIVQNDNNEETGKR